MASPVIVVDDDELLLRMMAETIRVFCGRAIFTASNLEELKTLRGSLSGCGAVFLDINLGPNQPSGIEACQWLKNQDYRGRIFFFTGHARNHPLVTEACALGMAELLPKPIEVDELVATLGKVP